MKASELLNTKAAAYVAVSLVGVVVVYFLLRKGRDAVVEAVDLVNPASSGNIVNRAVTATGAAVTGDSNWTLGGWIYDLTHPAYDPNSKTPAAADPADWLTIATRLGGK